MSLSGTLFIGRRRISRAPAFYGMNPATGEKLEPAFSTADADDVRLACELAAEAFQPYRRASLQNRAHFLETIASKIDGSGEELLQRANAETGLPLARLTGERGRTTAQLRLFADEIRRGGWQGLRVDPALPDRKPLPRSDLRQQKIPLGPVAVFGSSNFPLAFSVAGGDTASAFAAGCPVVVKAHPAHPGTSELVARAIASAVEECDLPEGVFSLLSGPGNELGAALVANPAIKAVGFTGSRAGGLALMKIAAARVEPIPVYAEMSSINPVVLLPGALAQRAQALGRDFVGSLTLGAGQFCTNPGLVLGIESAELQRFIQSAVEAIRSSTPATMLTAGIHQAYEHGVAQLSAQDSVQRVAQGLPAQGPHCGQAALFTVKGTSLLSNPQIAQEVFGAASAVVLCADANELARVLASLEGQLTATMHLEPSDYAIARDLIPIVEGKAGRLLVNGWPTGVEVSHAMVHGGPYPATSDGRSTSVGTLAIERFLRPVCYQDFPVDLLPQALRDESLQKVPRRYNGEYLTRDQ